MECILIIFCSIICLLLMQIILNYDCFSCILCHKGAHQLIFNLKLIGRFCVESKVTLVVIDLRKIQGDWPQDKKVSVSLVFSILIRLLW